MRKWKKTCMLAAALCTLLLTGCGTAKSADTSGSAVQGSASPETATSALDDTSLIQAAFDVDISGTQPETEQSDGRTQRTYTAEDGKIMIEWAGDSLPESLYYFRDIDSTDEPDDYLYPQDVGADAQTFLSDVFNVKVSDEPAGVYGYQNRVGVLMEADDGSYFHIQFVSGGSSVIGFQHFDSREAADTFYSRQNAEKLA
ncbi:hypothetical protein [Butyricicoccus sp.]|uniref:hypothetical protein n=1 Tax=Butyricicoccus sp. TaxID=2049021 RepID=UPI003F1815DE